MSLALGYLLGPHENPGPDALGAGIAAPHAASKDGDEEQTKSGNHQDRRQQDEILWPEGRVKDKELLGVQIPEHRLMAIPVQPGGTEEQEYQRASAAQAQVAEKALEAAGMDGIAGLRGRHEGDRLLIFSSHVFNRNLAGHGNHGSWLSGTEHDARSADPVTDSECT